MRSKPAPLYLATVLPGLESVASDEIAAKLPTAQLVEQQRGRLLFQASEPPSQLAILRTVDNLYLAIARLEVGSHRAHLADVAAATARVDLSGAAESVFGGAPAAGSTFFVNASRVGRQTYSRFELAEAVMNGIAAACPAWRLGAPTSHDLEFRLDLLDDAGLLSLRLTDSLFRYRSDSRGFAPAALRPSVAHGLVWLAGPRGDEVFLDPFCGSGTILAERAAYLAGAILGGDTDPEVLATAQANLPNGSGVSLARWDARCLPIDSGSVDTIVSNLPFGRQVLGPNEIFDLYARSLGEFRRVLRSNGRAYLLTDQLEALNAALAGADLAGESVARLSLKGLHPSVYRVTPA